MSATRTLIMSGPCADWLDHWWDGKLMQRARLESEWRWQTTAQGHSWLRLAASLADAVSRHLEREIQIIIPDRPGIYPPNIR